LRAERGRHSMSVLLAQKLVVLNLLLLMVLQNGAAHPSGDWGGSATAVRELRRGSAAYNVTALLACAPLAVHMVQPRGPALPQPLLHGGGLGSDDSERELHTVCPHRAPAKCCRLCRLPPAPVNLRLRLVLRRRSHASRSAGKRAGCFPRH
jgi:hypothetical protein